MKVLDALPRVEAVPSGVRGPGARIDLLNLTKRYGQVTAVADVSLGIAAGEFMTFLGPSGSGKTTTLMMVAGFASATEGEIVMDGRPVTHVEPNRRDIGMVFQNYALFPHMTVAGNVAFPLEMRGVPRADRDRRIREALRLVRLEGLGERRPSQLSGGQQQRVALARAVVFQPRALLLDEPLGALDAKLREEMKFELKRLHREFGCTILFVTHDQEEALALSDRVAVFHSGRVAQVGAPEELYRTPANRFVADFIGETNLLHGRALPSASGGFRLELRDGTAFEVPPRPDFPTPRHDALVAVRPEAIRLHAADPAEKNAGHVVEALYAGSTLKYLVRLADGTFLKVRAGADAGSPSFRVGASVRIAWDPGAPLLIEADSSAPFP